MEAPPSTPGCAPRLAGTVSSCRFPILVILAMLRRFFRKYFPADAVRSHRLVTMFGGWLQHPNLWHFNRRSIPGALAIGLFAGLVPGPLQMLTALLLAVPL